MQTKALTQMALMTALLAILAPISLPLPASAVAFTLATFALYLTAYLLPPKEALAAVGVYLLLGAAGLPVFSGYQGGLSRFAAPGGGYLMGYLVLVGLASMAFRRMRKPTLQLCGALLATLLMYAMGAAWMAVMTHTGWRALLMMTVCFLPADGAKLVLAWRIGRRIRG